MLETSVEGGAITEAPFKGYRTRRNHLGVITHLEVGDEVIITSASPFGRKLHKAATYIGLDTETFGLASPVFQIRKSKRILRGWECWWIRKDEAERIRRTASGVLEANSRR